jgi:DNA-directed RNA polymerase subunit RPC12/RpoP
MSGSIYFVQECPTCGRRVHIRIEYLGRQVVCQHCHGQFLAQDPANGNHPPSEDLLRRAEQLLENVEQRLENIERIFPEDRFRRPR